MTVRKYKQLCGVAKALDLVGDRWTLLIVRDLLLGPLRFSDLLEFEQGIGPNLLTKRLRSLEEWGLVQNEKAGRTRVYALTEEGERLRSVVEALGEFGAPHLNLEEGHRRRFDWLMSSIGRQLSSVDESHPIHIGLYTTGNPQCFVATLGPESGIRRGTPEALAAMITAPLTTYLACFFGEKPWRALHEAGDLEFSGDAHAIDRLIKAYQKAD